MPPDVSDRGHDARSGGLTHSVMHAQNCFGRMRCLGTLQAEMITENLRMVVSFLKMMRGQADRQYRDLGIKADTHQSIDNGAGDKIMPVNTAIHDQRGTGDGVKLTRQRQPLRHHRQLKRAGHVKDLHLRAGDFIQKTIQGTINDIGMPIGLDECKTGWCHS